jgi:DNA-binding GntR family transcriptional regulator
MTQMTTGADDPRLYVRITADLRQKISGGDIQAHANVSVTTLSQQWRVHRQTASKALRALEEDGLIRRYPGVGYYVLPRAQQPAPPHSS